MMSGSALFPHTFLINHPLSLLGIKDPTRSFELERFEVWLRAVRTADDSAGTLVLQDLQLSSVTPQYYNSCLRRLLLQYYIPSLQYHHHGGNAQTHGVL